jgi:hypothetical protein
MQITIAVRTGATVRATATAIDCGFVSIHDAIATTAVAVRTAVAAGLRTSADYQHQKEK